jgi:hypothetical protein
MQPDFLADDSDQTVVMPSICLFDYGWIQSLEGSLRQQFDANHAFFLRMKKIVCSNFFACRGAEGSRRGYGG